MALTAAENSPALAVDDSPEVGAAVATPVFYLSP